MGGSKQLRCVVKDRTVGPRVLREREEGGREEEMKTTHSVIGSQMQVQLQPFILALIPLLVDFIEHPII